MKIMVTRDLVQHTGQMYRDSKTSFSVVDGSVQFRFGVESVAE